MSAALINITTPLLARGPMRDWERGDGRRRDGESKYKVFSYS